MRTTTKTAARVLERDPVLAHDLSCQCPECFPPEEPTEAERREGEERAEYAHRRAHGAGSPW